LYDREISECYDLVSITSQADYEASVQGWHPTRKQREMKDKDMRYLLVRTVSSKEDVGIDLDTTVDGFLSFMLTHDSTPAVPVLYIYELHLAGQLRKLGLGSHLLSLAENIAERVGVKKVMLTCFLSNTKAHTFYLKHGYAKDVSSPDDRRTRNGISKPDYVIMSKTV
ncbi:hypothetical protein BAUCODRAFT_45698, partial [Baudoinia panamericana UAMH 10762]